jgi:hypothetical protein
MGVDYWFKILIREHLMLFGRSGYVEMISITIFSYVGYLPVYIFAPFMDVSTMCEETRLFTKTSTWLEARREFFYPT